MVELRVLGQALEEQLVMCGIKLLVGGRAWPPALVRLDPSSLFESGEDRSLRLSAEATAEVLTDDRPVVALH